MNMFARYSLILIALYMLMRTIISLFFYDQFPIAFLASEFNQDQMDAFRLTMQIMKYEEFISNTEKQIRVMH